MLKPMYAPVNGLLREIGKPYGGVDNVARKARYGYVGVNNVARKCFSNVMPIGELSVGDSVYVNVGGVATEFLVVHHGIPNTSIYDGSCEGTWLLAKDLYAKMPFDTDSTAYAPSDVCAYLTGTFFNLIDEAVGSIIKQVKIPYHLLNNYGQYVLESGSDGLSAKVFLLSAFEIGYTKTEITSFTYAEGEKLNYFIQGTTNEANAKRIAYYDGAATMWLTRTPTIRITNAGEKQAYSVGTYNAGVRPAFILPSETLIDNNFNVVI